MKIIKKDGRLEEFNINKIKTSIENAAKDSGSFLNSSDLRILADDIQKTILAIRKDPCITSSYEVTGIIFSILRNDGFSNILKAYIEFNK
ncbi:ATP cone domain-containing protein [Clostridium sp. AL.422]|uniref:ATP cone domain-containing protein n=1 Tax=Clostridium TaxID=1485 RepID=UPI00293DF867|nr:MULTISPECIES: ATP cone domain-containing protein [unclassified Clostridium]MDV4152102.1 ATP cone domain-containing protein [Clostridium sp. AL.422]